MVNPQRFMKKTRKDKERAIISLMDGFDENKMVTASKIDTLILLVNSDYDRLIQCVDFEIFQSCNVPIEKPDEVFFVNGIWDTVELLVKHVCSGLTEMDDHTPFISLKILKNMILDQEANKMKLMEFIQKLTRVLFYDPVNFNFKFHLELIDVIYFVLYRSHDRMKTFFKKGLIDTVVNFCKSISGIIRDIPLDERQFYKDTLLRGAELIALYYQAGNRQFQTYIEQKNAISIFLKFVQSDQIKLHHEITEKEVIRTDKVYESLLCTVYRGVYRGIDCAIKEFDINKYFFKEEFFKEIGLLTILQAPCVVKFYGAHTDSENPFILLDYFENGSLEDVTNLEKRRKNGVTIPITTTLVANFALSATLGLAHLHSKNIVHRDIKTANFLVDEHYNVKIIDFGVSRVKAQNGLRMTVVGTPVWMAPEVSKGDPYDERADIYSMGLLFWSLVSGRNPFKGVPHLDLVARVAVDGEREEIPEGTDPVLAEIIDVCTQYNPEDRLSVDQIIEKLFDMKNEAGIYRTHAHDNLGDETFEKIIERLDLPELLSLSSVSSRMARLIDPSKQEIISKLKERRRSHRKKEKAKKRRKQRSGDDLDAHIALTKSKMNVISIIN
eukprot:TRINITY_DN1893_c0_g1_i4.p1 TRINITY_DN1893_c0_g1~~TRINITY_DN1893_c0_g1_i4.p1  ORF type:complete len:611 (+),score=110.94 TRINITY_DN1893_c0_g1_i4:385-2217(+)